MDNKIQKQNNDETWMKEYVDFYDNMEDNKEKTLKKEKKEYKKSDLFYKIYRYEILLIGLFVLLGILSIRFEWNPYIVICWISILYFLAWFSSKADIPTRRAYHIFYYFRFYSTKRLYTTLLILTIIFASIYCNSVGGIEALILLFVIPISWFVWLFLWRFTTEITKFIQRAIKWEVDWGKVFGQLILICMIWLIVRICIKYDISWLIEKRI